MRRLLIYIIVATLMIPVPAQAKPISWVDFDVPYESLKYAMDQDIATFDQEMHISWIDGLALAACRTGGKCPLSSVKRAFEDLKAGQEPPKEHYAYYRETYTAVLGGLLGSYAIASNGEWVPQYGLKAFSPIAAEKVLIPSKPRTPE